MIQVYINYPNPRISIHENALCSYVGKIRKPGQRRLTVNADNLPSELLKFEKREYRFGATPATNDMWITIDLGENGHELEALKNIQQIIGVHYRPLKTAPVTTHCQPTENFSAAVPYRQFGDRANEIERQLRQLEEKISGVTESRQ